MKILESNFHLVRENFRNGKKNLFRVNAIFTAPHKVSFLKNVLKFYNVMV